MLPQSVQEAPVAPEAWARYLPAAQLRHAEDPAAEYVPAVHAEQSPVTFAPAVPRNLPASQVCDIPRPSVKTPHHDTQAWMAGGKAATRPHMPWQNPDMRTSKGWGVVLTVQVIDVPSEVRAAP